MKHRVSKFCCIILVDYYWSQSITGLHGVREAMEVAKCGPVCPEPASAAQAMESLRESVTVMLSIAENHNQKFLFVLEQNQKQFGVHVFYWPGM